MPSRRRIIATAAPPGRAAVAAARCRLEIGCAHGWRCQRHSLPATRAAESSNVMKITIIMPTLDEARHIGPAKSALQDLRRGDHPVGELLRQRRRTVHA